MKKFRFIRQRRTSIYSNAEPKKRRSGSRIARRFIPFPLSRCRSMSLIFYKNNSLLSLNFITSIKFSRRGLTTGFPGGILRSSSKQKPMTQTSRQNAFLPASRRRCEGGRNNFAEWTAEGGPNETVVFSKLRRAFPPLPRKGMCWHTAERTI